MWQLLFSAHFSRRRFTVEMRYSRECGLRWRCRKPKREERKCVDIKELSTEFKIPKNINSIYNVRTNGYGAKRTFIVFVHSQALGELFDLRSEWRHCLGKRCKILSHLSPAECQSQTLDASVCVRMSDSRLICRQFCLFSRRTGEKTIFIRKNFLSVYPHYAASPSATGTRSTTQVCHRDEFLIQ